MSLNEAVKRSERLDNSQRIIRLANEYLNAALEALAAKRGYLMTSDETFLRPYRRASNQIIVLHQQVSALVPENSAQQRRLEDAGNLFQQWLHDVANQRVSARNTLSSATLERAYELEELLLALQDVHAHTEENGPPPQRLLNAIHQRLQDMLEPGLSGRQRAVIERALMELMRYQALRPANDDRARRALHRLVGSLMESVREIFRIDVAIKAASTEREGEELLARFQQLMKDFINAEMLALDQHREEMVDAGGIVVLLVRLGPAMGLLFMILIATWMAQRIGRSLESVSEAAGELAKGNMEARADVRGNDEFAVLATRFNNMAELVESRSRESTALAELGELLQSCNSVSEATRIFARMAERILPQQAGVLYLVSPSRDSASMISSWSGGEEFSDNEFSPDDCWALRLGRMHRNIQDRTMCCSHLRMPRCNSVCLPLHAFGETIGLLTVISLNNQAIERPHTEFLETVAEQLGLALANLRLRETLRNQSIRDPLTGLYNRRYLEESFRRELHRVARHDAPLSLLTFDIDHFKRFNDTHGHDGGDAVLRAVGHCLQELFRAEDGAFRSGGEEFVALLAETELDDALVRAEELRKQIARLEVHHNDVIMPSVTISVGVAAFPRHGRTTEQLLKAADRALYRAKELGRNRVVSADSNDGERAPE